jgi:hypothetical protein
MVLLKNNSEGEALMFINITKKPAKHVKSTIKAIINQNMQPFINILTADIFSKYLDPIGFRERFFSSEITLFGFLSQALNSDKSLQAALAQIIAHLELVYVVKLILDF